jgi:hypothetical protein
MSQCYSLSLCYRPKVDQLCTIIHELGRLQVHVHLDHVCELERKEQRRRKACALHLSPLFELYCNDTAVGRGFVQHVLLTSKAEQNTARKDTTSWLSVAVLSALASPAARVSDCPVVKVWNASDLI